MVNKQPVPKKRVAQDPPHEQHVEGAPPANDDQPSDEPEVDAEDDEQEKPN